MHSLRRSFPVSRRLIFRTLSPCQDYHPSIYRCVSSFKAELPDFSVLRDQPVFLRPGPDVLQQRALHWKLWRILQRGADGHNGSLPAAAADAGLPEGGWRLVDDGRVLERTWTFRRFRDAWSFLKAISNMAKRAHHAPPTVVHNDKFVLIRLTNRGESPDSTDAPERYDNTSPSMDSSSDTVTPFQSSDDVRRPTLGLTHTTLRLAAQASEVALTFNPVGVGEENETWWREGGQAEVTEAARRLLAAGRAVEGRERVRAKRERQLWWRGRAGKDAIEAQELAEDRFGEGEKRVRIRDDTGAEELASPRESKETITKSASAENMSNERPSPTEIAACAALNAAGNDLSGRNWVGIANLEEQRRRRRAFQERRDRRKEAKIDLNASQST